MVIDSSAVIAILRGEPEAESFARMVYAASECHISAMTVLEAGIVIIQRQGPAGCRNLDMLIADAGIEIVPFDAELAAIAREAFERFGRGRHPAQLNFGDCAAYALARSLGQPLLFKGGDFAQTDIPPAL